MTRFLVIDRPSLGRAALDAAQERDDALPLREPGEFATPYDAVVADTFLMDEAPDGDGQPQPGGRVTEVQAPDFGKLAWRLAH